MAGKDSPQWTGCSPKQEVRPCGLAQRERMLARLREEIALGAGQIQRGEGIGIDDRAAFVRMAKFNRSTRCIDKGE